MRVDSRITTSSTRFNSRCWNSASIVVNARDHDSDVADAESALARLRTQGQPTLGLESLTRSLLRSEAVASSWIEALQVSHRRLAEAERQAPGHRYDEARRVLGNVRAMAAAVEIGAARQ